MQATFAFEIIWKGGRGFMTPTHPNVCFIGALILKLSIFIILTRVDKTGQYYHLVPGFYI